MDNPLTPNKIQRLMHLAADKSFNLPRRLLLNDEDLKRLTTQSESTVSKSTANYESSSGILDLEKVEAFGESSLGNVSLSKSTAFNPGEMTGRSTGTEEVNSNSMGLGLPRNFSELGRHSLIIDSITNQMDKQTSEVHDVMRHSIATNYSFHSKRDLTADEASLVMREAPLPVHPSAHTNFAESMIINNTNMSMGTYFKNRCPEFGNVLGKTDSPDRSQRPSITEVSVNATLDHVGKDTNIFKMDQTLDSVPVKQPRNPTVKPENFVINNLNSEKQITCDITSQQDAFVGRLTSKIENPKALKEPHQFVPVASSHKNYRGTSSKPTDVLIRNLQGSLRVMTDDTEGSVENSFSISKIADYLGKQSNVSITDMMQLNNKKKPVNRKSPLTELHLNTQENNPQEMHVTNLKDSKGTATASSAESFNTVISFDKLRITQEDVPAVIVTQHSAMHNELQVQMTEDVKGKQRSSRSKSPSSKSRSTLSTVQENFVSFKTGDSPLHSSKGEANASHIPSPNVEYKELDKSVDWHEVLLQKQMKQEGLVKEQWADIITTSANGFVGVSCPITITVTTLTDSWLTAKFQFDELPHEGQHITVELPRFPLLLSPGKSEQFTLHITSTTEINTSLPFTMFLKDASVDNDIEQKGTIDISIKMPEIQSMSSDGVNKVNFPPTAENTMVTKSFVLMSNSRVDLQLDLSISEGDKMFSIKSAQEIKRCDVNKVLVERTGGEETGRGRGKVPTRQLCRLTVGNATKVTVAMMAPKLSDAQLENKLVTFRGLLDVKMMGVNIVLRKIELTSLVGLIDLAIKLPADRVCNNKLLITKEKTTINVQNTGTIAGVWVAKSRNAANQAAPFVVTPEKFEIRMGRTVQVTLTYTGPEDASCDATIIFEETTTGNRKTFEVVSGSDKPKLFPIKTNHNILSWVRAGRKEISLKNSSDRKVHVKCQIVGEGFSMEVSGADSRGIVMLSFGPCECRILPIMFTPNSYMPHSATLHVVFDKNSEVSRKVKLFGSASPERVGWLGLVTYGDTALVRAVCRAPVELRLQNRGPAPAFICACVHFNLQYMCVSGTARVMGGRNIVPARARHCVTLHVEWARVERRAHAAPAGCALATLTVLAGAEYARRRILRILKNESLSSKELDTSLLPEHLKVLVDQFEGEDPSMDDHLKDFNETKSSLNELIGGLQELTAQIDLPQDFAEENTIIITDDTVIEHFTLCE